MPDWQVNIIKNSVFWQFMQFLGSISQYCIVITTKTCFELALHQNRPRAANFVGKRWIHNDFGWFLQLLLFCFFAFLKQFCWSILAITWGSKHPKYQSMNHAIINHCWAGISVQSYQLYQLFLPFRLCCSQKSIFDIFWGAKKGPPEA